MPPTLAIKGIMPDQENQKEDDKPPTVTINITMIIRFSFLLTLVTILFFRFGSQHKYHRTIEALSKPGFVGNKGYCLVRMNPDRSGWPAGGGPVSLTRLVTALRKSLVRAGRAGGG
jgi:hypothetical protein